MGCLYNILATCPGLRRPAKKKGQKQRKRGSGCAGMIHVETHDGVISINSDVELYQKVIQDSFVNYSIKLSNCRHYMR